MLNLKSILLCYFVLLKLHRSFVTDIIDEPKITVDVMYSLFDKRTSITEKWNIQKSLPNHSCEE